MQGPTLEEIRTARQGLEGLVVETPVWRWRSDALDAVLGAGTQVLLKLELFQHAGSFKPRGALCNLRALSRDQLSRGVTAESSGNPAMALGYAPRAAGTTGKVGIPANARGGRLQGSRDHGAGGAPVEDGHPAVQPVEEV